MWEWKFTFALRYSVLLFIRCYAILTKDIYLLMENYYFIFFQHGIVCTVLLCSQQAAVI